MRPNPPCWTDGVDCPNRHVGCQGECEKYKAFRAECEKINAARQKAYEGMDYAKHAIWRKRKIFQNSPAAKKMLGQR